MVTKPMRGSLSWEMVSLTTWRARSLMRSRRSDMTTDSTDSLQPVAGSLRSTDEQRFGTSAAWTNGTKLMNVLNSALARSVTAPLATVLPKDGAAATHALLINGGIGTTIDSMRPLAE